MEIHFIGGSSGADVISAVEGRQDAVLRLAPCAAGKSRYERRPISRPFIFSFGRPAGSTKTEGQRRIS
jgi:hypothetical protein